MTSSMIAGRSSGCSRRKLLSVSLTGLGAIAVAACSSNSSSGSNPAAAAAPTTVPTKPTTSTSTVAAQPTVAPSVKAATNASTTQNAQLKWINPSGDPTDIQIVRSFFKRFQELNPTISVQVENAPTNFDTKLQTEIAGGVPPDVTYVQILTFPGYAARGIFSPLDPLISRDKLDLEQIFPNLVHAFTYKGSIYALPKDNGSSALAYNKDLFKKFNVAEPTADWTWQDFLKTAQQLTAGSGPNRQFGFQLNADITHWSPWVFQNKGQVFNADATTCLLGQPAAQEALQFLADTAVKYHYSPTPDESKDQGYMPLFFNGKVAMQQIWPGQFPAISKSVKFDWDVAMLPTGKQQGDFVNGAGNATLKTTRFPEACWTLIKFFESKEGQDFFLQAHKGVPSLKEVGKEYVKLPPPPTHRQVLIDDLAFGTGLVGPPNYQQIGDIFTKELADLWNGRANAQSVTEKIITGVTPLMGTKNG